MLARELTKDYMKDYQAGFMPSYEVCDITWGEEAESLKRCIIGALCKKIQPDQPWMRKE